MNEFNEVWARATAGDEAAITDISVRIEKRVFALARNRIRRVGRLLAESGDVVQEALYRFWSCEARREKPHEFKSLAAFHGYLDKVALSVIAAMLAARSERTAKRLSSAFDVALLNTGEPPTEAVTREKIRHLERVITDLSESERVLLHDRLVRKVSYEELAEGTEDSPDAVKRRFERIQKKIIDLIAEGSAKRQSNRKE